ncbi:MAG TPA: hypothetical protein VK814_12435 [Acidobacteriaceae bacterium]|nr:hypothetical protein [Acidobacteriaceae bacterium]
MMLRTLQFGVSLIASMLVPAALAQQPALVPDAPPATQNITIAEGVPLYIRVTRTANLHTGQPVAGVLTAPIFVRDRMVLPTGSTVHGTVVAYVPVEHLVREEALLNGDVTPLRNPVVNFTTVHLAADNTDVPLDARALISDSQLVRFTAAKKQSLLGQGVTEVKTCLHDTYNAIFAPGRKDRAMRLLYSQLPYHPQRIWSGTQFVAELSAPLTLQLPTEPPVTDSEDGSLGGKVVDARLAETLTSATAKKGDTVVVLVTAPVFDQDQKLILPEGAQLDGLVSYSKPARSFGRNGQLRFAIRGVKQSQVTTLRKETVYGTLSGAAGSAGENLSVDSEGNVKANPDKNRFVAPLLLAVTAMAGADEDADKAGGGGSPSPGNMVVASNGFGLVARVVAVTVSSRNVALGFGAYAFAKSIYFRFLIRGHEVTFARDTQLEITFSAR